MLLIKGAASVLNTSSQEGSGSFDRIRGAAALNEGSVILVGETDRDFVATNQGYGDFATFELDANGTVLWRWQVMSTALLTVFAATSPS